jgi:hypothetical protein
MKKSQTAIEAALLIGFLLIVFSAFVIAMNTRLGSVMTEKNLQLLKSANNIIKSEVDMAVRSEEGYSRVFELPETLEGYRYNLTLHNGAELGANFSEVIVRFVNNTDVKGEDVSFLPPSIIGAPRKGNNTITKKSGIICFNQPGCS